MTPLEISLRILAGFILIGLNAYFVAIEFGLTRARQYSKSEFDTPSLELAWKMTEDLEFYLTTCQIWISGTSIALGIVAEPGLAAVFEPLFENTALASIGAGSLLGFLLINLVHLTHGEQTPTYLGVERSKQVCQYGARPLYWFAKVLAPAIWFGDWIAKKTLGLFGIEMTGAWQETEQEVIETRADLRNQLGSVLEEGELSEERREEVMNAFNIGEQSISEVMVPTDDIVALSTEDESEVNLQKMEDRPQTRYPLIGDNLTDFQGILYTPILLRHREELASGNLDFAALAAPPMTLSPDADVSDAIDQFQAERQELALVIEDGEVIGLVTVTDLLEAIMGDIEDPLDQESIETPNR
ncbi:CNNM domain-containing protein [Natrinema versiforme]|uniref:HlyC/CorC family transporter n=1 Tax=Natrinema versiforme TaxID=88724 RepID=A0A4V1G0E0_9EURY|nr:hemolysin family protein [Natrinema versiforme]QCS45016.1 HlyC/CorC family transporter [Natrinema versiforme]